MPAGFVSSTTASSAASSAAAEGSAATAAGAAVAEGSDVDGVLKNLYYGECFGQIFALFFETAIRLGFQFYVAELRCKKFLKGLLICNNGRDNFGQIFKS